MLDLNFNLNKDPFPFVVIDNFLPESMVSNLNSEFPESLLVDSYGVLANRKRLTSDKITGSISPSWDTLLSELESEDFCSNLIEIYNEETGSREDLNNLFLYYDISLAGNGYKREIHRDNDNRVINFIYHINDFEGEGGQLGIYSSNKDTIHRKQNPENVHLIQTIPHKKNRMIFFISTFNSYHSLFEIKNCISPRKFIYGSLTRRLN